MLDWIAELEDAKARFGPQATRRKRQLLRSARATGIDDPKDLIAYHEALCFLRAFPDDAAIMDAAERELRSFRDRVSACRRDHGGELPDALVDSGIVGTVYHYPFGLPIVSWLLDRFGDAADIDWDEYDAREEDDLSEVLPLLAAWIEGPALDDEDLSAHEWIAQARGGREPGALRWLVGRLRATGLPDEVQETLFNRLNLSIRWDLGDSPASRTLARLPSGKPYFHHGPLRGRTADLRREVLAPRALVRPVPRGRARGWIDLARAALSVRDRELYSISLASEEEVYVADVGRGLRLAVIGTTPDRRLPIEANFGVLVVKNGMPIGYGASALLLDRVEEAYNIFPTFRQGESSFVFEQWTRFFHQQFGARDVLIERYQIGHENDEGLEAGAFWFYFKLGFRPAEPKIAALAEEEAARLRETPGARTPRRTLKRLARSNMILRLDPAATAGDTVSLGDIGLRVSRSIEERFHGDRDRAGRVCAAEVARDLGVKDLSRWPADERRAFTRLSPLIRLLPSLPAWGRAEKRALVRILRAKGSARDGDFARLVIRHRRLRDALQRLGS